MGIQVLLFYYSLKPVRASSPIMDHTFGLVCYVVCHYMYFHLFNPNHPKSFKIFHMLLYDFGGFRLVECSYHVFTWGLMSQFCLRTKNVPFGYCTV